MNTLKYEPSSNRESNRLVSHLPGNEKAGTAFPPEIQSILFFWIYTHILINHLILFFMRYKLVSRANPQDRDAAPKYYAVPVYSGVIDLKRIASDISEKSSLTAGDVLNVLSQFIADLPKHTKDGAKVSLGDFGSFRISFSSEGVDDPKLFNAATMIRGKKILYRPGTDIKGSLDSLRIEHE